MLQLPTPKPMGRLCGFSFLVAVCPWASLNLPGLASTTLIGQKGVIYSFSKYMNSNHMPGTILGAGKQWNPYL